MKIVILDAQGGGMGRQLVEGLKKALPNQPLIAVGTNALATAAMLRARGQTKWRRAKTPSWYAPGWRI